MAGFALFVSFLGSDELSELGLECVAFEALDSGGEGERDVF